MLKPRSPDSTHMAPCLDRGSIRYWLTSALIGAGLFASGLVGGQSLPPPPGPYPLAAESVDSARTPGAGREWPGTPPRFVPLTESPTPPARGSTPGTATFRDSNATGGTWAPPVADGVAGYGDATGAREATEAWPPPTRFAPPDAAGAGFQPTAPAAWGDSSPPSPWRDTGIQAPGTGYPPTSADAMAGSRQDRVAPARPPAPGAAPAATGDRSWDPWTSALRSSGPTQTAPRAPPAAPLPAPPPSPRYAEPAPSFAPQAGQARQPPGGGPRFRPTGPNDWR